MTDTRPLPRMADYTAHVRRYWRRLTILGVIGAIAGGSLFLLIDHRYVATSRVLVSPQITYLSLSSEQEQQPLVSLDTTAALLSSDTTIEQVADAMGATPREAVESLQVTAEPLTRVLIVQIRADSERAARRGVIAAVDSMLEQQSEKFALADGRVRLLKRRVATLQAQAQDSITTGAPSQSLFDTVRLLQTRLDRAVATNNTTSEIVVRAAVLDYRPGEAEVFLASGLMLGLALALISAGRVAPAASAPRGAGMAS